MNKKDYLILRQKMDFNWSQMHWFYHFFLDLFLLLLILILLNSRWNFIIIFIIPIFCFRCFAQMHEAVHSVLHKNKFTNDILGIIYGGFCFLPFKSWQKIHMEHHYWSGHVEKDPTMKTLKNFRQYPLFLQKTIDFCWRHWLPMFAFLQHTVFWLASFVRMKKNSWHILSILAPVVVWTAFFWITPMNTLIFLILGSIFYLYLVEWINLPHHVGKYCDQNTPIWEQAQTTRTCRYPDFFEKYIAMYFNFHNEHHMFPDLPAKQLPQVHEYLLSVNETMEIDTSSNWLLQARRNGFYDQLPNPKTQKVKLQLTHPLMNSIPMSQESEKSSNAEFLSLQIGSK